MALSAAFTVNGSPNPATHTTTYGATVTCALQSITGVNSIVWEILAVSHPGVSAPTITRSGTPNGQTATFTMVADGSDGQGRAVLIRCTVTDSTGTRARQSAIVGVANAGGLVPVCPGEEGERSPTHGWAPVLNEALSGVGGGGLTPPTDPADDKKIAYADSGDLAYASITFTGTALDLGSSNLATTSNLQIGSSVATTGSIRAGADLTIYTRRSGSDLLLIESTSSGTSALGNSLTGLQIRASSTIPFIIAGQPRASIGANVMTLSASGSSTLGLASSASGSTGNALSITGEDRTGSSSTGGAVVLRAGTGTSANGELSLNDGTTPRIRINGTGLAFFNTAPVAKPTVTGSRGSNAALASLLTALANLGLVTDSSS